MSRIWTPPSVRRELREETARHKAEVIEQAQRDATCDYWDRELQKIDSALTLVKARDDAQVPGLRPGYWHVIRNCDPAPPSILPLVGDDGEFVEPTSRLLDRLRAGDLQNPRVMEEARRRDEAREKARLKERETGHEERVEEMMGRWRSLTQTSVSMDTSAPWSQAVAGRRGRKESV